MEKYNFWYNFRSKKVYGFLVTELNAIRAFRDFYPNLKWKTEGISMILKINEKYWYSLKKGQTSILSPICCLKRSWLTKLPLNFENANASLRYPFYSKIKKFFFHVLYFNWRVISTQNSYSHVVRACRWYVFCVYLFYDSTT